MIVFADMDGTLFTSDKRLSAGTFRMLDELLARGMEFVPATGRPLSGVPAELLAHPAVHYVLCSAGAAMVRLCPEDRTDLSRAETIMSAPLPREKALELWDMAKRHDVTFEVMADGDCLQRRDMYERLEEFSMDDPNIAAALKTVHTPVDEEPEETIARVGLLERVIIYWRDPEEGAAVRRELDAIDGIDVTRSFPNNFEVAADGVTKGSALRWLCGHLAIPVEESVAFGDSFNDLAMLRDAGAGYAMLNADREAKEAADRVTAWDNDHDGVARTVMSLLGE